MKVIKISAILSTTMLITLFIMVFEAKNPLQNQYDAKIEMLMATEGFSTESEVLLHYPTFSDIKKKMEATADLNYLIQSKVRGPVPSSTEMESLELQRQMQELRQLQQEIGLELKKVNTYQVVVSL